MEFFRIRRDIPFMRYALVFNVISLATFALAVFFLLHRGLHLSIEFTGGTVLEMRYAQAADLPRIRHAVEGLNLGEVQVQNFGTSHDVVVRVPVRTDVSQSVLAARVFDTLCTAESGKVVTRMRPGPSGELIEKQLCEAGSAEPELIEKQLCEAGSAEPVQLQRSEFVGPQVGKELAVDGGWALVVVVLGIMVYLAIRFEWKFAIAAIVANLHDVIIILGFFALFGWEFSLSVLAAVLAVLGYSVNESVVIFDRIRETFRSKRKLDTHGVIDHAITSTISRTIITHGSTQMMVLFMLIFGGQTLHNFALALTIGILFGIYSSVFVAAAIAMWLGIKREDLAQAPSNRNDPKDPNAGAVV